MKRSAKWLREFNRAAKRTGKNIVTPELRTLAHVYP
jgi:hypothetical protein